MAHTMLIRPPFRIFAEASVIAVAGILVFTVPFHFPPDKRLQSASYVFGYNNRIAIIILGCAIVLLTAINATWRAPRSELPIRWSAVRRPERSLGAACIALACWYLFVTAAIYFLVARRAGFYKLDWESSVFIWHLRLVDVYHLRPYLDFRAEYGPALVYLPYWFFQAVKHFGIADEPSYYALHYLLNTTGLVGIAVFIALAKVRLLNKCVAFALLGISAFQPQMGLNELSLRYLSPYFGLLVLHLGVSSSRSGKAALAGIAAAFACGVTACLSPEIWVAYMVATAAYALMLLKDERKSALAIATALVGSAILALAFLPQGYFQTFSTFSAGANNLPILPVPHILLYLGIVLILVPRLLAPRLAASGAPESLLCALGLLSLALMPGALGRCDPLHTFSYGLGILMLAFLAIARAGQQQFGAFSAAYFLVFICGLQYSNARVNGLTRVQLHSAEKVVYQVFGTITGRADLSTRTHAEQAPAPSTTMPGRDVNRLFSALGPIGLPWGSYGYEKWVLRFLWSTRKLIPEAYIGTVGVYTPADFEQRILELSRIHRILIFHSFLDLWKDRDTCAEQQSYLRLSLLFPGSLPCLHPMYDTNIEFARYIKEHYRVVQTIGNYYVMERVI